MQSFKDNEGTAWNIALTLGKVRQLREKLGLDLLDSQHHLQVLNSLTDRLAFVFLLVEEQAKERDIDAEALELRLCGDGIATSASVAFCEELASFFQRFGQQVQARLTRTSIQTMERANQRLAELIDSGKVDSMLKDATKEMEAMMLGSDGSGLSS